MAILAIGNANLEYDPVKCPGLYCGRVTFENGSFSECGACPRGQQPNEQSICQRCTSEPIFYDWMYLAFMALLSLMLHLFFIDVSNRRHLKRRLLTLHVSALIESVLAAVVTLLLVEPMGQLTIRSCPVHRLSDWYTMLYNPSPNYTTTLHCTQEIVYPLYTVVLIYYAFSLLFLMLIRPTVSYKLADMKGTKSIYAALYFHPVLILVQAVLSGLLYYSFPYIVIVLSVITSAIHMSGFDNENSYKELFKQAFCNGRNLTIIVAHWFLHAFGIIALTQLQNLVVDLSLLVLVPLPVIFYILTVKFTDPDNLDTVS
ncbi:hypothetical protein FSP39_023854 [Pinctada imbricata]|uniref:JNK1/MAPK8-associated membrane protein n=1 Tax=Pinctada imbricata TaxID=66713 RepID=A0AA88XY60_PINIB|nr:hypothetical protein FSP39_023854 [Pinctada imbricata]